MPTHTTETTATLPDRDGKRVTVAEAENATGTGFDHETLDAIVEVAAYLPPV